MDMLSSLGKQISISSTLVRIFLEINMAKVKYLFNIESMSKRILSLAFQNFCKKMLNSTSFQWSKQKLDAKC